MKTFKNFFWLIAVMMVALPSCKDSEDILGNGDYYYYLDIQSEVRLHLADNAEDENGMAVDPVIDRLSRTIYFMKTAVNDYGSMQGEAKAKEAAMFTVCDSLYRNYADVNPATKGFLICYVKLVRCHLRPNGTVEDPMTLKYYRFWYDKPDYGGGDGGSDSTSNHLAKPDSLKAIDLGLSVLWANCNIGATQPSNYGARLAWGEPTGTWWSGKGIGWDDTGYTWNTEYYGGNNPPADISGSELDVVAKHWGDGWRIPSYDEAKELCEQCQWKLRNWGDIKWYEVIGPNGNSIIMPLAGLYSDNPNSSARFQSGPVGVNERGLYWTSTSCTTPCTAEERGYAVNDGVVTAWCFGFNCENGDDLTPGFKDHLRAFHMSIRPVLDK